MCTAAAPLMLLKPGASALINIIFSGQLWDLQWSLLIVFKLLLLEKGRYMDDSSSKSFWGMCAYLAKRVYVRSSIEV